jgi:hypothetical protein
MLVGSLLSSVRASPSHTDRPRYPVYGCNALRYDTSVQPMCKYARLRSARQDDEARVDVCGPRSGQHRVEQDSCRAASCARCPHNCRNNVALFPRPQICGHKSAYANNEWEGREHCADKPITAKGRSCSSSEWSQGQQMNKSYC